MPTLKPPDGRALLESLSTRDLTACVAFGEGRGETSRAREAIVSTGLNRVQAGRFGTRLRDVWLKRWAYSALEPQGGPDQDGDGLSDNYETVLDAARVLRRRAAGEEVAIGPIMRDCLRIADAACAGTLADPTRGSTHYLTAALFRAAPPAWARGRTPTVQIGAHLFFTGVA